MTDNQTFKAVPTSKLVPGEIYYIIPEEPTTLKFIKYSKVGNPYFELLSGGSWLMQSKDGLVGFIASIVTNLYQKA